MREKLNVVGLKGIGEDVKLCRAAHQGQLLPTMTRTVPRPVSPLCMNRKHAYWHVLYIFRIVLFSPPIQSAHFYYTLVYVLAQNRERVQFRPLS